MKKILKITGIVIGVIILVTVLAAVLFPVLFKDQLVAKAKEIINENINARVDFKDVSISIFKNFPDVTLSLNNISLVGIDDFKTDTLASIASFNASMNIMTLIKNGGIDLKTVSVKNPHVHAIVLENGKVNWDIAKTDTTQVEEIPAAKEETSTSDISISLAKVEIINGAVLYHDNATKMVVGLKNLNFLLKGNISSEQSTLDMRTSLQNINLYHDGIRYLTDVSMKMNTKIEADLNNRVFTLKNNETTVGPIVFQLDGGVKMTGEKQSDLDIDLTYAAKIKSLSDLVKMAENIIPESKKLNSQGDMALRGWVKGIYNDELMPQVWAEMAVADGYLKYADLPESINNINIEMKALYDGNNDAKTTIDVSRFHVELAGNPFDITASVRTPMTDAYIKAAAKGKVNFESLANALPMEGINLAGLLTADVKFAGYMSAISDEQYDKLDVAGNANLKSLTVKSKDLPMLVRISNTDLQFTPRYVELKSFNGQMGKSDIQMQGKLENFINYILKDEMLKGTLTVNSTYIDCNEIMTASAGENSSAVADSTVSEMAVIVLPGDIDFTMNVKADKIIYDKLTLSNAGGSVVLRGGELIIDRLTMGFAGGTMALTGKYKADDPTKALAGINMDLKNVDVSSILNSFDMFDKILPVLNALSGKVSLGFNFATDLDSKMSPVLTTLNAVGTISTDSVTITQSDNFNKIMSLVGLSTGELTKTVKSVNATFVVQDGKVQITPFPVKLGTVNMMVGGQQGLDQIADFHIDMAIPAKDLAGKANDLMQQMGLKGTTTTTVNVGVAVGGTISSPTFRIVKPQYMDDTSIAKQAAEQAKDLVKDKTTELLQSLTAGKQATDSVTQNKTTEKQEKVNETVNQLKNLLKKKE